MPFIFVWAKGKIKRILVLNVPPSATFIRTWHLTLKNKTKLHMKFLFFIWFISIFYKEAPAWLTDMSSHLWQQTINADCWVLSLYFPSLKSKFLTCKFLSSCIPSPPPTQMITTVYSSIEKRSLVFSVNFMILLLGLAFPRNLETDLIFIISHNEGYLLHLISCINTLNVSSPCWDYSGTQTNEHRGILKLWQCGTLFSGFCNYICI